MKAKKYIIAMLIPAFIGTLTINAQSAHRRSSDERTRTTSTHVKNSRTKKQPAQKVNTRSNQQHTNRQLAYRQTTRDPKHVSISNNHNPGSKYGKANRTVHNTTVRYNKKAKYNNSNKYYYGGKHYHHAYPARKVKGHYHYDTYRHNYRVLYYPAYRDIYWTRGMYREYVNLYPTYTYWHYNYGHRIQTISIFEARFNLGDVSRVYGRVYATWYNRETDDYLLFFGGDYPQQEFTMVIPGNVARRFSRRPQNYFPGRHIAATGLITSYEGKPEMVLKQRKQISLF